MAEYLDRKQVLDLFVHSQSMADAYKTIALIPATDVRPVVRGKWVLYKDRDSTGKFEYVQWICSACKSNVRTGQPRFDSTLRERPRFNFCPNCGADMRGEQDEKA